MTPQPRVSKQNHVVGQGRRIGPSSAPTRGTAGFKAQTVSGEYCFLFSLFGVKAGPWPCCFLFSFWRSGVEFVRGWGGSPGDRRRRPDFQGTVTEGG